MRITAMLTVTLVLMSAIPAAAQAPANAQAPLADRLPEQSLIYFGWAGATDAFNAAAAGQMLQEPALAELFKSLQATTMAHLPNDDQGKEIAAMWEAARLAWRHRAALSLVDLTVPKTGPRPMIAFLVDLGSDKAAFAAQFEIMRKPGTTKDVQEGGLTYKQSTDGAVCFGYVGDTFFFTVGEGMVARLLAVKAQTSLAASKKFQAAFQQVQGPDILTVTYADIPAAVKAFEAVAKSPAPTDAPQEAAAPTTQPSPAKAVIAALGLDKAQALVSCTRVLKPGLFSKTRLISPGPHRGLLGAVVGSPLPASALTDVPADADIAVAANISLLELWREALKVLQHLPDSPPSPQAANAAIQEVLGLSIEDDVLAPLQGPWTLASAPSLGGFLTGTAVWVDAKDPQKLQASIDSLCQRFLPLPDPQQRRRRQPLLQSLPGGAGAISYIAFAGESVPVAPAWTIQNNRLHLALFPQVLTAATVKPAAGLATTARFMHYRKLVSPNASMIAYTDSPRLLQQVYPLLLASWSAAANASREIPLALRADMLPTLLAVRKYVSPEISALSSDDGGVTFERYSTLPAGDAFVGLAPVAVAVAVPVVGSALGEARKTATLTNLKTIGGAYREYQMRNNKLPEHPGLLIEAGYLPAIAFRSAFNQQGRPTYDPTTKRLSGADVTCVPYPSDSQPEPNMLLAYDNPRYYDGQGTPILTVAGNVFVVDTQRFNAMLQEASQFIQQSKKAPPEAPKEEQ
ncbi:MAG: DUF3352 domain-containing protein [Planctomycetaceae bacterium]|nr:DUF3352 domain-containing protein [Planctomycetaceae bacterium]